MEHRVQLTTFAYFLINWPAASICNWLRAWQFMQMCGFTNPRDPDESDIADVSPAAG